MFDVYRNAVVTGATSGIGEATVRELSRRGLTVYAVGRSQAKLDKLTGMENVKTICADVRDTPAIAAALAGIEVDVLINNAGVLSTRASFHEIDPAEIDAMIDVNLKAPMHLTRALVPGMVQRRRGHLLFVGSTGGRAPFPNMAAYGPSKAGLSLFCDNLRCDLLGTSIRVTEIVPGRVKTELYSNTIADNQANAVLYDGYRPLLPEQVSTVIANAIELPAYADIARIEILPTDQMVGGGAMVKATG